MLQPPPSPALLGGTWLWQCCPGTQAGTHQPVPSCAPTWGQGGWQVAEPPSLIPILAHWVCPSPRHLQGLRGAQLCPRAEQAMGEGGPRLMASMALHRRTRARAPPLSSRSVPQCIPDFMGTFFLSS